LVYPPLEEKLDTMIAHITQMVAYKGEYIAMRQARKLVIGYFKGMKGAAALRNEAGKLSALEDIYKLRNRILNT
jgi:tRNA-dihydrouridine synthase